MKNQRGFSLVEILIVLGLMGILSLVVLMPFANKPKIQAEASPEQPYDQRVLAGQFTLTSETNGMFIEGTYLRIVKVRRVSDGVEFYATVRPDRVLTPYEAVAISQIGMYENGVDGVGFQMSVYSITE